MKQIKISWARKIFKIFLWAFLVLVVLYLILLIGRAVYRINEAKTTAEVEKIHNTKLTLDDVMGKNLPPDPGANADTTVAGIDANKNGIRDDVELAIFNAYPDSAKTRAVLLQYALVLQMQMTLPIINKETVTATVEDNESRANICMWNLSHETDNSKFAAEIDEYESFVKNLQTNTEKRKTYLHKLINENLDSYSASNDGCDLDLKTLSN